ncbi:MAG: CRISPR-associated helicase Cas3' [Gammaproteobacteria bacterium]|nr:CRISPR-associated helicase Cas3' [Gammaproteobacteria bacterium]MDE0271057.1 CRISPR-associated helicase Cas3' [Gammaproteobacteria bacterium]
MADALAERSLVDILEFWGKAQPIDEKGPRWHSLVCHSLDVAAVAEALLTQHAGLASTFSRWFDWPRSDAVRLIAYLICLHDIGKFAKRFQSKAAKAAPERFPSCFPDDPRRLSDGYDHGAGGLRLFDADPSVFAMSSARDAWRPLISAVVGHHGSPPAPQINKGLTALRPDFGKAGIEAARTFVQHTRELLDVPEDVPLPSEYDAHPASFALAGLAVLADWIGSNQEWFRYQGLIRDLGAYWEKTRDKAKVAVAESGVLPAEANRRLGYDDLIGPEAKPTPMQREVQEMELPTGPALFLIEDETGSGKTEAAMMLAHRLMASKSADGLYVALPTMATANAMFDRLAKAYRQLFAQDSTPSISLSHGAREMHRGFQAARLRGARKEKPYSDPNDHNTTASAACAEWVADDRRRAFLADVGAGTVDQALLSVLPSRHQSLRLLGLMRRALILDEVHAYDAYMQQEIERLLEFQAGLGGSAILLSATLPASIRERLTTAFSRGLQGQVDSGQASPDYPLLTVRSTDQNKSITPLHKQSGQGRTLPIRWLRSPGDALMEVERAARKGNAVLYIRNTVDDALDAYKQLSANDGLDIHLFHARFALYDRLSIERQVVDTFGKASTQDDRQGQVLIATQVVEQSLDLDFDVLITDLAPMDLLMQRAGRLWRHQHREERKGKFELLVVGPEAVAEADAAWFADFFPGAAYVYRDHARLWLTARTLEQAGQIESPGELRRLMDSVYGEEADTELPEALQGAYWETEGRTGAERGVAITNLLNFTTGYLWDGGAWDKDSRTPSRLNDDPQVTLRLARMHSGRIQPYAQDDAPSELWRAWRLSEVNISRRHVGDEAAPPELAEAIGLARADWSSFEKDKILVVLNEPAHEGTPGIGIAMSGDDQPREVELSYDRLTGLTLA